MLDSYDNLKTLPIGLKTVVASFSAGMFRILLMPVDACKTTMQVCCTVLVIPHATATDAIMCIHNETLPLRRCDPLLSNSIVDQGCCQM